MEAEAKTQEAHLPDKKAVTREDALKLIVQQEVRSLFRREHLKRETIMGLIGLRGDGKSGSGACIALVDHLMRGEPVWSNMSIRCDILVDDSTAMRYGMRHGGVVHYESIPLEKEALLKLDQKYTGGYIYIDEINVEYSNVRRFMSNTNVDFNTVVQELRKFKSSLGYSVIDEMFIDSQLRTLTDIFIKSEDTALSTEGLISKKPTGIDFKWTIYPMSGYMVGREQSYYATKKALPPVYFHFAPFRGIYDTALFQRKGVYSAKTKRGGGLETTMDITQDPALMQEINKWEWLEKNIIQLKHSGIDELEAAELWRQLKIRERPGVTPEGVARTGILANYGITKYRKNRFGGDVYKIDNFDLDNMSISEYADGRPAQPQ